MRLADGVAQLRGALTVAECARWTRAAYAARGSWTPNFDGVQFTLGRAYYTHLEEDRAAEYFAGAAESDALVERTLPGLQGRLRDLLSGWLGAPVERRPGWCGPGLHIFPAGGWLSENGGDLHFDTEGLRARDLASRAPAMSAIAMLQPAARGGGLRVWSTLYEGDDEVAEDLVRTTPHQTIDYELGDLVMIDSYRLHQIQPFTGALDRLSATAHLVLSEGRWQSWF